MNRFNTDTILNSHFKSYHAEISAGSLMPLEIRRIAELFLNYSDEQSSRKALVEENILQKKSPATALRVLSQSLYA